MAVGSYVMQRELRLPVNLLLTKFIEYYSSDRLKASYQTAYLFLLPDQKTIRKVAKILADEQGQ